MRVFWRQGYGRVWGLDGEDRKERGSEGAIIQGGVRLYLGSLSQIT